MSRKTYWAREGMEFGVSKEHVGPDKTLDWVSQKDIMIWAMNRGQEATGGGQQEGAGNSTYHTPGDPYGVGGYRMFSKFSDF